MIHPSVDEPPTSTFLPIIPLTFKLPEMIDSRNTLTALVQDYLVIPLLYRTNLRTIPKVQRLATISQPSSLLLSSPEQESLVSGHRFIEFAAEF